MNPIKFVVNEVTQYLSVNAPAECLARVELAVLKGQNIKGIGGSFHLEITDPKMLEFFKTGQLIALNFEDLGAWVPTSTGAGADVGEHAAVQ